MLSQIDSKVPLNGVVVPQSLFTKMIIQKDQSARKKALNTTSPLGPCEKATFLKEKYGTKLSTLLEFVIICNKPREAWLGQGL
jgi:hypothetical protein